MQLTVTRHSGGLSKLVAADLCQEVRDFRVAGYGFSVPRLRVFPQRVFFSLSPQNAAMPEEVPEGRSRFIQPRGLPEWHREAAHAGIPLACAQE
jgi:hypothetical protein